MVEYFPEHGFSSRQVCVAVADAVLRDREINGCTFPGFPAVELGRDEGGFWIVLRAHGAETEPRAFGADDLGLEVSRFERGCKPGEEFFLAIQEMVVQLEAAVGEIEQGGR